MGCTPPPRKNDTIPAVNSKPIKLDSKSVTSIEEIIQNRASTNAQILAAMDIKIDSENRKKIIVAALDFQNKTAMLSA